MNARRFLDMQRVKAAPTDGLGAPSSGRRAGVWLDAVAPV